MAWSPLRTAAFLESGPLRGLTWRQAPGSPQRPAGLSWKALGTPLRAQDGLLPCRGAWGEPAGAGQEAGGRWVSVCDGSSVRPDSPVSVERPEGPD